jgi:hypothetical protein
VAPYPAPADIPMLQADPNLQVLQQEVECRLPRVQRHQETVDDKRVR